MLEKILVPLDGSELGELALDYAKELATAINSEVHLLSVVEKRDLEYRRMIGVYLQKIAEETQLFFNRFNPEVTVRTVLMDGVPADEIIEYARNKRINLVILVSHGHSGIMPWSMGSTANKVVNMNESPVLLVRASMFKRKRSPIRLFSKILLPLDGSEVGEYALPIVSEIARKLESKVILFSVIESAQHVRTIGGQDYIHYPDHQIKKMKEDAIEYLALTIKKLTEKGINARSVMKEGNAANEIITFAMQNKISLVAMSSHGRSGMRGWVFGSVSNKVLQAGKSPLLIVKAQSTAIEK